MVIKKIQTIPKPSLLMMWHHCCYELCRYLYFTRL
jgi:hypothetical protein